MEKVIPIEIETEQEVDGRWIAEAPIIIGAMAYGATQEEAIENVKRLIKSILAAD